MSDIWVWDQPPQVVQQFLSGRVVFKSVKDNRWTPGLRINDRKVKVVAFPANRDAEDQLFVMEESEAVRWHMAERTVTPET